MLLFRTNGHSPANDRSDIVLNASTLNGISSAAGHGGSMREQYDKLANERAQLLAEASLLKA